ncbi:hypothetical protein F0562_016398 [Nyssa sinensis]|uniref:Myb-like domain-containing protein n=1 Tax=Nyssa sinensis TaxID=561372 RepID=A0A5J4ZME8_9ASTE|nr:hypothetical protein F0562_016398 [Nyssa sinensis]
MGGKVSITHMPVKRVLTIKPEKLKKKGNIWSRDCFPSPDFWLPQEDAMLCAVVHEYGPHWSLASEILYVMTAGGFYRGRFRHPVHCCERFRELIQKYVLSAADNLHNEKACNTGSGKALLKITEDNIRMLLDVATELPDNDPLLQKHFFSLLSSVWRATSHLDRRQSVSSSWNGLYFGGRRFTSTSHPHLQSCLREKISILNPPEIWQENHFRAASSASIEDCPGWALSAFLTGDIKSRTSSKSQSLGKHKLSLSNSIRPSKSKMRKTIMDSIDMHHEVANPLFQPMLKGHSESNLRFDMTPPVIPDVGLEDFDGSSPFDMDKELSVELESLDGVPHNYIPGFIAGLDDCSSLPEFTDIG